MVCWNVGVGTRNLRLQFRTSSASHWQVIHNHQKVCPYLGNGCVYARYSQWLQCMEFRTLWQGTWRIPASSPGEQRTGLLACSFWTVFLVNARPTAGVCRREFQRASTTWVMCMKGKKHATCIVHQKLQCWVNLEKISWKRWLNWRMGALWKDRRRWRPETVETSKQHLVQCE